jgi:hypothetical protein
MALYIPTSRRRRQTIVFAVVALAVGLVVGLLAGRASVPSLTDRVHAVQEDARQTASGLRVLSLHEQAGAVSTETGGAGGADLVLQRTRDELQGELSKAPWLAAAARQQLLDELSALDAQTDRNTPAFASAADALASHIDDTFGLSQ